MIGKRSRLLVILISLVVDDVEELELVNTAGGGDDTEPVTKLLLLEELLGPVCNVSEMAVEIGSPYKEKEKTYRYLR